MSRPCAPCFYRAKRAGIDRGERNPRESPASRLGLDTAYVIERRIHLPALQPIRSFSVQGGRTVPKQIHTCNHDYFMVLNDRPETSSEATRTASMRLDVSARPCPAISNAVPCATLVAHNRQSKRHIDRAVKSNALERDVALVVIHGNDRVELARQSAKQSIRRNRARDFNSCLSCLLHSRLDDANLLVAEQPVFPRVGI